MPATVAKPIYDPCKHALWGDESRKCHLYVVGEPGVWQHRELCFWCYNRINQNDGVNIFVVQQDGSEGHWT